MHSNWWFAGCFIENQELLMKHATQMALDGLLDLLTQIRARRGLQERQSGIFYKKSKSFLHFHEDPTGMYADLSVEAGFKRYPVNTKTEWKALLLAIDHSLESN
jgi:hypothetical protein